MEEMTMPDKTTIATFLLFQADKTK